MKRNLLIILSLIIFASCEKTIEVKTPPYTPLLVVSSYTGTGSTISADISKSIDIKSYNQTQPLTVTDAKVKLFVNGSYVEDLIYNPNAVNTTRYTSTVVAQPGNTYKIVAAAGGLGEAEATTTVPEIVPITALNYTLVARQQNMGPIQGEVSIKFKDPATEGDYYMIEVIHGAARDTAGMLGYYPYIGCVNSNDPSIERLSSFSFGADDCIGTDELYLGDALFNGKEKEFKFFIDSDWLTPYQTASGQMLYTLVRLHHVTPAYFRYMKSYRAAWENDGNPFAEPVNVNSNVQNGYGTFSVGAVVEREVR